MGFSPCFIVKSLKQIQSFIVKSSFFTMFHLFFDGKPPPGPPPLQPFPPFRWSLRNSSVASSKRVPIRSASAPKMGRFVSSMGTWNAALGKSLTFLRGFHQQQVGIDRYIYNHTHTYIYIHTLLYTYVPEMGKFSYVQLLHIYIWQCVKTLYPCSSHQNSW